MDIEKQENQAGEAQAGNAEKKQGGFFKALIIVGALFIIAGILIAAFYMKKKSSGSKALEAERKLIKVNWQNKN